MPVQNSVKEGMQFLDRDHLMVTVKPCTNKPDKSGRIDHNVYDWWCVSADQSGGLYSYTTGYILQNLVVKKNMRLFVWDYDAEHEEIDLTRVVRLEIQMPDGSKYYIHESDGLLVIHTDGQLVVEPRAANMVYLKDQTRSLE